MPIADETRNIKFTFKMPVLSAPSKWIRLAEGDYIPETVSFNEAASIVDNLFEITPCEDTEYQIGGVPVEFEGDIDEKLIESFGLIEYDPCKYNSDGSYVVQVSVYRSHDRPYKLVLTNGIISKTTKVDIDINTAIEVQNKKSFNTGFFIYNMVSCSEEIESINGSTVFLKEKKTGFVTVSFKSNYELLDITVLGSSSNEPESCLCIAYYEDLTETLLLSPPPEDTDAINKIGCDPKPYSDTEDDDGLSFPSGDPCYQRVIVSKLCLCSDTIWDSYEYVEQIRCPPPGSMLSGNTTVASAYTFWWENKDVYIRRACPSDGDWEGQEKEFYKEKCCVPVPTELKYNLPTCEIKKVTYFGNSSVEKGGDYWKSLYGPMVEFYPIRPKNSTAKGINKIICGEIITKQEVKQENCCDPLITPPIVYDTENSVEVLSDNSNGYIFWQGGLPPFNIQINGSGFYLDRNHTYKTLDYVYPAEVTIEGENYYRQKIYTEDACGPAVVSITDGCTTDTGSLKSTDGNWVGKGSSTTCGSYDWVWTGKSGNIIFFESEGAFAKRELTSHQRVCGYVDGCSDPPDNYIGCTDDDTCNDSSAYEASCHAWGIACAPNYDDGFPFCVEGIPRWDGEPYQEIQTEPSINDGCGSAYGTCLGACTCVVRKTAGILLWEWEC
jgi:hypothetical protein